MPESLYRPPAEVGMLNRTAVEKMARDAGHAINANNGRCPLIEDVLCRVTTLCVELLNEFDEREYKARQTPASETRAATR
jgi:hypothetical protein